MTEQTDETTRGAGTALKRRGLIAGAAALVAGMVAKQTAEPVAAGGTDHTALIIAETNTESTGGTTLTYTGSGYPSQGAALLVTDGGTSTNIYPTMVQGIATTTRAKAQGGVYGEANLFGVRGVSSSGTGVLGRVGVGPGGPGAIGEAGVDGMSNAFFGVIGTTDAAPNSGYAGVLGVASNQATPGSGDGKYGVHGYGMAGNGIGVQGEGGSGSAGVGVKGVADNGFPIVGTFQGVVTNTNAAVNGQGLQGPGVQGQSNTGHGLVGYTTSTDGHAALIGYAASTGGIGLIGNAPGGASPGLAGVFNGDVVVNGALRVYGSPKNAAVKHPDNSYRLLYCEESPESWFADYGEGTLTNGKAEIKLDPDFAALVHADKYHVFLTEYDDHQGLYVTNKGPTGFTVVAKDVATPTGTKAPTKAGGTFSYRIVARRKDITGERLAKVAAPPAVKPVTPFTVPETPAPKLPARKP